MMAQNGTPTPVPLDINPYIISLSRLGKWTLFIFLGIILLSILLKIILDLRRFHYKD